MDYKVKMTDGSELYHYGILGQKWYLRRYQNADGSLTEAGKKRYSKAIESSANALKAQYEWNRKYRDEYSKQFRKIKKSNATIETWKEIVIDWGLVDTDTSEESIEQVAKDYANNLDFLDTLLDTQQNIYTRKQLEDLGIKNVPKNELDAYASLQKSMIEDWRSVIKAANEIIPYMSEITDNFDKINSQKLINAITMESERRYKESSTK